MGSLHDCSSRVCLGALDGVAVADGVEDLKDTVFGQFVDLLHLHPLQWNDPSGSFLIPITKYVDNESYKCYVILEI